MEPEINASEYSNPAKLADAIQSKINQLYVDWVWVNFPTSRQKVTPTSADNVCKGLVMAHDLMEIQVPQSFDALSLFSVAYKVSQRMDERQGRSPQKYTPEEAWERLDSTQRIMWQDEICELYGDPRTPSYGVSAGS